jgi:ribonuclease I
LKNGLVSNWPNLLKPSDYAFWTYEWDQHGKCSSLSNSPLDYFQLALRIQTRKDLKDILKAANIVPKSGSGTHTNDEFIMTIFRSTGAYPQLKCFKDSKGNDNLLEIRLCLDHDGRDYKNCTNHSNDCGPNIKWSSGCDSPLFLGAHIYFLYLAIVLFFFEIFML